MNNIEIATATYLALLLRNLQVCIKSVYTALAMRNEQHRDCYCDVPCSFTEKFTSVYKKCVYSSSDEE